MEYKEVYKGDNFYIEQCTHSGAYIVHRLYGDGWAFWERPRTLKRYEGYNLEDVIAMEEDEHERLVACHMEGELA